MATAQSLIDRSIRLLGAVDSGDDPTDDERTDALEALNALIKSWHNKGLIIPSWTYELLTLTTGQAAHIMSSGGDFNTTNLLEIPTIVWVIDDNQSYPLKIISLREYGQIADKTLQGRPDRVWIAPTTEGWSFYFFPVPDSAYTIRIPSKKPFTAFSALSDSSPCPEEYDDAIVYNLAIRIAPEFKTPVPQEVAMIARDTMRDVHAVILAREINPLEADNALLVNGYGYSIENG